MKSSVVKYVPGKSGVSTAKQSVPVNGRTFHVSDYRRTAGMLKTMRRDNRGQLKNTAQQDRVDALALSMAAVFEADSHEFGVPFSAGYFLAGTR